MELAQAAARRELRPGALDYAAPARVAPVVAVRALTKRFAPRRSLRDIVRFARAEAPVPVVNEVTLDVMPGEIFGLLGPNGAGKTTIFKMLSTMVAADSGTAEIAGLDIGRDAAAVRRILACVPADERSLSWRLTARDNLSLFAALQKVPHAETESRMASVLATVALADTGKKRVAEFSSGMRQRLLIARALLTEPAILLLDEPTRTLDPLSARELRRFLRDELVGRLGATILLATHNTDEAFGLCDRVAVLHRGRVLAAGAPDSLAARFGEERYRLVVRATAVPALSALERSGVIRSIGAVEATGDEDWIIVECAIAGDPSRSATVLRTLIEHGVEVARLERVETSLADLIASIIGADARVPDDA